MKDHLTEQQLLEYQFKLASDSVMQQATEHLELCEECRENLEKLQKKFAALDLLRGDVQVTEDLISCTTEQAKQPARIKRTIPLYKRLWLGAAAAVILIGAMAIVTQIGRQDQSHSQVVREPQPVEEKIAAAPTQRSVRLLDNKTDSNRQMLAAAPQAKATGEVSALAKGEITESDSALNESEAIVSKPPVGTASALTKGASDSQEGILESESSAASQPPFAPASAIELVTLPRRDRVQLTIYNSADLTLVRERRNLTMKKGWNWLQFMWAGTLIDPTSLSLEPLAQADKIEIQQLVFPARLRELGRWLVRSEVSGQVPFEITYLTSGLSWRAFYTGTLSPDEKTMQLAGYVRVTNSSGEDYENAQTRLIVGQVHLLDEIAELASRQYPYGRPGLERQSYKDQFSYSAIPLDKPSLVGGMGGMMRDMEEMKPKEIVKEGLSEYFLYTIEGTETIPDKWAKRLLSFEAEDIEVESLYKYDEDRWGGHTIRFVSFANDQEHNLGRTPIPNGDVKIYSRNDSEGHLSYVGGTNIKYIPVNEEIELNLGPARLVKVEPKLMNFEKNNYVFDPNGNVTGWDEIRTWQIEITNTRTLPVKIEITRGFETPYWTLESASDFTRHDATHVRFELNIEPTGEKMLEYTVTTRHGTREDLLNQ